MNKLLFLLYFVIRFDITANYSSFLNERLDNRVNNNKSKSANDFKQNKKTDSKEHQGDVSNDDMDADRGDGEEDCGSGDSVSYDLIKEFSRDLKIKRDGDDLHIGMGTYFSGCIDHIDFDTRISNNNIFIKFKLKLLDDSSEEMEGVTGENITQKYKNCMNKNYGSGKENSERKVQGKFRDNFKFKSIKLNEKFNLDRDSKIIIASPSGLSSKGSLLLDKTKSKYGAWGYNCLKFENPEEEEFFINKSYGTSIHERACKNKGDLSEIEGILEELRSNNIGNLEELSNILGGIKLELMEAESNKLLKELRSIEEYFSNDDDDDDDNYGVSKKKGKERLKKYVEILKDYEKNILGPLEKELKFLLEERIKYEDDDDQKDEIDKKIARLNEIASKFVRSEDDENNEGYREMWDFVEKHQVKFAVKKIIQVKIRAVALSSVYKDDRNERRKRLSLKKVLENVPRIMARKIKKKLSDWKDIEELSSGSKAPIRRDQNKLGVIKAKAAKDKENFNKAGRRRDAAYNNYANNLKNSYCRQGTEACLKVDQYLVGLTRKYNVSKESRSNRFLREQKATYGRDYKKVQRQIGKYNRIWEKAKLEKAQEEVALARKEATDFELDFDRGNNYDFYDDGDEEYYPDLFLLGDISGDLDFLK